MMPMAKVKIVKAEIAKVTEVVNVFICLVHEDEVIKTSKEESLKCPDCSKQMDKCGWFEE